MGHTMALKLGDSLIDTSVIFGKFSKVHVESFRYKRAGRYVPLAGGERLIVSVSFVKNDCINLIPFINNSKLYDLDGSIGKQLEVSNGCGTTIEIVGSSDREKV